MPGLQASKPPEDRQRDREIEQRVHDREAPDDDLHQARREHHRGVDAHARPGLAGDGIAGQSAHRDRRQRRWKSQRESRRAAQKHRKDGAKPEVERRLHEVRHRVEVHDDPVVREEDLASDFAVGGLAVIPKGARAQARQGIEGRYDRSDEGGTRGLDGRQYRHGGGFWRPGCGSLCTLVCSQSLCGRTAAEPLSSAAAASPRARLKRSLPRVTRSSSLPSASTALCARCLPNAAATAPSARTNLPTSRTPRSSSPRPTTRQRTHASFRTPAPRTRSSATHRARSAAISAWRRRNASATSPSPPTRPAARPHSRAASCARWHGRWARSTATRCVPSHGCART